MRSTVQAILIRLGIGVGIVVTVLIVSLITRKISFFTNTLPLIGIIIIAFLGMAGIGAYKRGGNSRNDRNDALSFGISGLLVGLPILVIPAAWYLIVSR